MHQPLRFEPLYMERVWGGRRLESVFGRRLPESGRPIGEAWEIVDRPQQQSVVRDGPCAGRTLHELWRDHREEIFGRDLPKSGRFPLLVKILDARDDLSIQVHPPAAVAPTLDGEPKTEMWFIAAAEPGAKLCVGLRRGVTRAQFERAIAAGTLADCVHTVEPQPGESIFIPSGRLHAIGAGLLIFEIQQNSDTTFRVFDWNRPGLDGQPRQLHVAESLASIDFDDIEPAMTPARGAVLADCPHFRVEKLTLEAGTEAGPADPARFSILGVVSGRIDSAAGPGMPGDFLLLPAGPATVRATTPASLLRASLP